MNSPLAKKLLELSRTARKILEEIENISAKINLPQENPVLEIINNGKKIRIIQQVVCEVCGVTIKELTSKSREKRISDPRWIAMDLCVHFNVGTLRYIGHCFGKRGHGTVIHGRDNARHIMEAPQKNHVLFRSQHEKCRRILEERFGPTEAEYII